MLPFSDCGTESHGNRERQQSGLLLESRVTHRQIRHAAPDLFLHRATLSVRSLGGDKQEVLPDVWQEDTKEANVHTTAECSNAC
ncbi:hypothetical protein EYF80_004615 [Liparis tanakae]|uniref:Uncharacterized protein n=1 Tax=Liparis tanakae TaxID=230148 RepID=A0A4Z2J4I3_9TELE|nr:hypothetical protein EYF80_004615 [Liparis tanakae]